MSVHFFLTIKGDIINHVPVERIGIAPELISDGVHWAQNFIDVLCIDPEIGQESEGHLWSAKEPSAQIRLSYLIERVRYTMSMTTTMDGYGQRIHLAELLSLLHAAQTMSSLRPDDCFELRWF